MFDATNTWSPALPANAAEIYARIDDHWGVVGIARCSEEARILDEHGLDGGGHAMCLAPLNDDGTCPLAAAHHTEWIAYRATVTTCTPEGHIGNCTCGPYDPEWVAWTKDPRFTRVVAD